MKMQKVDSKTHKNIVRNSFKANHENPERMYLQKFTEENDPFACLLINFFFVFKTA